MTTLLWWVAGGPVLLYSEGDQSVCGVGGGRPGSAGVRGPAGTDDATGVE